jgi:DNA-binding SARP family transcriptional activator
MAARLRSGRVRVELLGGFRVVVGGVEFGDSVWPSRRNAELVQLPALSPRRWLPREQVIEALWARLGPEAGAANLRKAAHYARQALGREDAVVLSLDPPSQSMMRVGRNARMPL